ncbi:hypothetical protein NC652_011007 [Populus alba x Populus x berolinensis]|nr:hypothetical protein NC652_011007 [Populus alba x Populus x berolinensis]
MVAAVHQKLCHHVQHFSWLTCCHLLTLTMQHAAMLDMADCYQLSSHLTWTCILQHVLREGNSCAVGLVKLGASSSTPWWEQRPYSKERKKKTRICYLACLSSVFIGIKNLF